MAGSAIAGQSAAGPNAVPVEPLQFHAFLDRPAQGVFAIRDGDTRMAVVPLAPGARLPGLVADFPASENMRLLATLLPPTAQTAARRRCGGPAPWSGYEAAGCRGAQHRLEKGVARQDLEGISAAAAETPLAVNTAGTLTRMQQLRD